MNAGTSQSAEYAETVELVDKMRLVFPDSAYYRARMNVIQKDCPAREICLITALKSQTAVLIELI